MPRYKVLFIGLGRMGYQMASHISKSDMSLYVFNRTSSISKTFCKTFNSNIHSPSDNINYNFIITCLRDDVAINNILLSKNLLNHISSKTIIVDHSTISLKKTIQVNKYFNKHNISFFDAPVTGGEEGAINGSLSSMVGGEKKKFIPLKKILSIYCKNIIYMGPSGNGQLCKFSNQILICGILISISESIKFNKANQLDQKLFYNAVVNGAAGSWQLSNRFLKMINNSFNFGFATELMAKDLRYVLNHAKTKKLNLSLTNRAYKLYKKLSNSKFKKQDTSSILKLI